jgi:hypothetical protein
VRSVREVVDRGRGEFGVDGRGALDDAEDHRLIAQRQAEHHVADREHERRRHRVRRRAARGFRFAPDRDERRGDGGHGRPERRVCCGLVGGGFVDGLGGIAQTHATPPALNCMTTEGNV